MNNAGGQKIMEIFKDLESGTIVRLLFITTGVLVVLPIMFSIFHPYQEGMVIIGLLGFLAMIPISLTGLFLKNYKKNNMKFYILPNKTFDDLTKEEAVGITFFLSFILFNLINR